MFVKKLVEIASKKNIVANGSGITGLRAEDVSPRLTFHYGLPADASLLAVDPTLHILAVATRNGQIKLFGRDNTQALLQSDAATSSKFLRFVDGQGILLNVTTKNQLEVWDIDARHLCHVHLFDKHITSFTVLQNSFFMYIGDSLGNISLLKLDLRQKCLLAMPYWIPFSESYGTIAEAQNGIEVMFMLPQPFAECDRVLILFRDGLISLWDIKGSRTVFLSGRCVQQQSHQDSKTVVSACWTCTKGSKVAVGYSSGDIFLWGIPVFSNEQSSCMMEKKEPNFDQNAPLLKLNLGYRLDKVPIVSLWWVPGDGKTSRLYINGFSENGPSKFQVLILNESSESRTIQLVLPLAEACLAMELLTVFSAQKNRQNVLVLLLKSGQICLYDDSDIEQYLVYSQSRSPPTLPNQSLVRLPYGESQVTIARFYTSDPAPPTSDEDYFLLANKYPWFLSFNTKDKGQASTWFSEIHKTQNLYITGHLDGTINFWDATCPLFLPIATIKQQNEDNSSTGTPITSLHFDMSSNILISGHQSGLVRIITCKKGSSETILSFLHAKPAESHIIHCVKLKGAVLPISSISNSKHFAVGTDKGIVSVINVEDATILYQKQLEGRVFSGIRSLQFENYNENGSQNNILLVGMEDSSILALEEDTGKLLSTNSVQTKNPSRAIMMQSLEISPEDSCISDSQDASNDGSSKEQGSKNALLLLCSDSAVRLYSLNHAIQGVKKVLNKKKLSGSCCYASVVYGPSFEVGIILVFVSGKIEIRSLPDFGLLKETSLRGLKLSTNSCSPGAICCSSDGELILVNGDQEMIFFSVLCRRDIYRHIASINLVYRKDMSPPEVISHTVNTPKEKKKGLFGMVMRDPKGSNIKQNDENGTEDFRAMTAEELSSIFSAANFPSASDREKSSTKDDENVELNIDDIDIDGITLENGQRKHKGPQFPVLSKQKLSKGLQTLKDKLKPKSDEKLNSSNKRPEEETPTSAVDQIKMKYGYSTNDDLSSVPKMIGNKLQENVKKLEGIGMRTADMVNNAESFSALAKELLRNTKNGEQKE